MVRAHDCCAGARHHCDRPRGNRLFDKILAIHPSALKSAKYRTRRDLAMIDGESRYRASACRVIRNILHQRIEPHHSVSLSCHRRGVNSDMSTSRRSSGMIPSIGPMRITTFLTTGAAV